MLGIYNFTPQTHRVSIAYTGATVLWLQFLAHLMFFPTFVSHFYVGTFRTMCAVPRIALLSSSLILCFLVTLLRYFLNNFLMIPVAPIITGITCAFTFHMRCIYIVISSYFRIFLSSFFTAFVSSNTSVSIIKIIIVIIIIIINLIRVFISIYLNCTMSLCYVCVCVCIYIYIYIYIHTHTHTHIYIMLQLFCGYSVWNMQSYFPC